MLKALDYLHTMKVPIIHRDIKPKNILYSNTNHFVLADFGCARPSPATNEESYGAFEYMAPEFYNKLLQSQQVDIWSLGALCLDILVLVPELSQEDRGLERLKKKSWCEILREFARCCNKPEVEMMVRIEPSSRPTAGMMLEFLKDSPSTQMERVPASEEIVYLIFKGLDRYFDPAQEEIHRKVARDWLRQFDASQPGSSSPLSRETLLAQAAEEQASKAQRQGSVSAETVKSLTPDAKRNVRGLGKAAIPAASSSSSAPPPTRSEGIGGPSGSTAHPSSTGSRGAYLSATPLSPDMQWMMDQLGLDDISQPSGSITNRLPTGLDRLVGRPTPRTPQTDSQAAQSSTTSPAPGLAQDRRNSDLGRTTMSSDAIRTKVRPDWTPMQMDPVIQRVFNELGGPTLYTQPVSPTASTRVPGSQRMVD
jgi:serine/threonine protein kinase